MDWDTPLKPAEFAESRLIEAILNDYYPIESYLPAERELAARLGVTRPTLRETLQRLARDGWIEVRHGRPTRVRNYWQEGTLGLLGTFAHYQTHLPENLPLNILIIRKLLAPTYTQLAVSNSSTTLSEMLEGYLELEDTPEIFSVADFELHRYLTIASGNPIFTLILNGFSEIYINMALRYFTRQPMREHMSQFYRALFNTSEVCDSDRAKELTERAMQESIHLWESLANNGETNETLEWMG